jgi:hypothetical protein
VESLGYHKILVQSIRPIQSSTPTSSASVELLVLSFCLVDTEKIAPLPICHSGADDAPKLDRKEADFFHSTVAKLLFLELRARPDVMLAVSFLQTKVSCLDIDDRYNASCDTIPSQYKRFVPHL